MTNETLARIVARQRKGFLRDVLCSTGLVASYLAVFALFPL